MKILGIHDGHNASACLLIDGNIRFAVQEERLRREKNYAGFPSKSIELALGESGLELEDIDYFAIVGREMQDQNTRASRLAMYREFGQPGYLERVRREQRRRKIIDSIFPVRLRRSANVALGLPDTNPGRCGRLAEAVACGIPREKIRIVEHHLAHAAAAYYGYGSFDREVLILTNDGEGDQLCATVNMGRAGRIKRLASVPRSESVGNLYSVATFMLGMVPLEHEYKLMGMAPYADHKNAEKVRNKLAALFTFDGAAPLGWKRANGCPDLLFSYSYMRDLFELDRFDSICGGLQQFTEDILVSWVRNCLQETGARNLALSGGVFMNVKLNKAIMELPEVQDLFVFPSCSDETNSIGAAYWVAAQHEGHRRISPLRDLYFGRSFDNQEVSKAVDEFAFAGPVSCEYQDDIELIVAELLANGEIVARFRGREEFGARALGNRSILADPSNTEVVKGNQQDDQVPGLLDAIRNLNDGPAGRRMPYESEKHSCPIHDPDVRHDGPHLRFQSRCPPPGLDGEAASCLPGLES